MGRPNVLVILTDQLRYPPAYESEELARRRAEAMPGVERLRRGGVSLPSSGAAPGHRPPAVRGLRHG